MKKGLRLSAVVLFIFLVGLGLLLTSREFLRTIFPAAYIPELRQITQEHGVDPYLALAVMRVESNFKPGAESGPGARGLMQILPDTGAWIAEIRGIKDFEAAYLYRPKVNIDFGCWYLNYLLDMFDQDVHLTLAAYNAGLGRVKQWLQEESWDGKPENVNTIPFLETKFFIRRVLAVKSVYEWIYPSLFPQWEGVK